MPATGRQPDADEPASAHPECPRCGYDLSGAPKGEVRCSECGAEIDWSAVLARPTPEWLYDRADLGLSFAASLKTAFLALLPKRFWSARSLAWPAKDERLLAWLPVAMLSLWTIRIVALGALMFASTFVVYVVQGPTDSLAGGFGAALRFWGVPARSARSYGLGTPFGAYILFVVGAGMAMSFAFAVAAGAGAGLTGRGAEDESARGALRRAAVYSLAWLPALYAATQVIVIVSALGAVIGVEGADEILIEWPVFRHSLFWTVAIFGWLALWWSRALRLGLRAKRPTLVWLAGCLAAAITLVALVALLERQEDARLLTRGDLYQLPFGLKR